MASKGPHDIKDINQAKIMIRGILISSKEGLSLSAIIRDLQNMCFLRINPSIFGFKTEHEFLCSIPDVVQVFRNGNENWYRGVTVEAVKEISTFISKQKAAPKRRRKVTRVVHVPSYASRGITSRPISSSRFTAPRFNSSSTAPRFNSSSSNVHSRLGSSSIPPRFTSVGPASSGYTSAKYQNSSSAISTAPKPNPPPSSASSTVPPLFKSIPKPASKSYLSAATKSGMSLAEYYNPPAPKQTTPTCTNGSTNRYLAPINTNQLDLKETQLKSTLPTSTGTKTESHNWISTKQPVRETRDDNWDMFMSDKAAPMREVKVTRNSLNPRFCTSLSISTDTLSSSDGSSAIKTPNPLSSSSHIETANWESTNADLTRQAPPRRISRFVDTKLLNQTLLSNERSNKRFSDFKKPFSPNHELSRQESGGSDFYEPANGHPSQLFNNDHSFSHQRPNQRHSYSFRAPSNNRHSFSHQGLSSNWGHQVSELANSFSRQVSLSRQADELTPTSTLSAASVTTVCKDKSGKIAYLLPNEFFHLVLYIVLESGPEGIPGTLLLVQMGLHLHRHVHCYLLNLLPPLIISKWKSAFQMRTSGTDNVYMLKDADKLKEIPAMVPIDDFLMKSINGRQQLTGELVTLHQTYLAISLTDTRDSLVIMLSKMNTDLSASVSLGDDVITEKHRLFTLWRVGELCIVYIPRNQTPSAIQMAASLQGYWYRAQIISTSYLHFERSCSLYLLDYGVTVSLVNPPAIAPDAPEYRDLPPGVILVELDGVLVTAEPSQFAQFMQTYVGQEVKLIPSELQSNVGVSDYPDSIHNVLLAGVQVGNKLLSDIVLDAGLCKRGRQWAGELRIPSTGSFPVRLVGIDSQGKVTVSPAAEEDTQRLDDMQRDLAQQATLPLVRRGLQNSLGQLCVWKCHNIGQRARLDQLLPMKTTPEDPVGIARISLLDQGRQVEVPSSQLFVFVANPSITSLPYQITTLDLHLVSFVPEVIIDRFNSTLQEIYSAYQIEGKYVLRHRENHSYLNLDLLSASLNEIISGSQALSIPVTFAGVEHPPAVGCSDKRGVLALRFTDRDTVLAHRIAMIRWMLGEIMDMPQPQLLDLLTPVSVDCPPVEGEMLICRLRQSGVDCPENSPLLGRLADRVRVVKSSSQIFLVTMDRHVSPIALPSDLTGLYRMHTTTSPSLKDYNEISYTLACALALPPLVHRVQVAYLSPTETTLTNLVPGHTGHITFLPRKNTSKDNLPCVEVSVFNSSSPQCVPKENGDENEAEEEEEENEDVNSSWEDENMPLGDPVEIEYIPTSHHSNSGFSCTVEVE